MGLGGATIKPDDPLPDFTEFDQSKVFIIYIVVNNWELHWRLKDHNLVDLEWAIW